MIILRNISNIPFSGKTEIKHPTKQAIKDQTSKNTAGASDCLASYNRMLVQDKNPEEYTFDIEKVEKLNIPNFHTTNYNGIRGESLSSPKNRKFIKPLKEAGIKTIIDLRDKFASESYSDICRENDIEYSKIPIDSFSIPDRTVIDNFPTLFKLTDKGNYYIACAQGLHRTDIALALNYVFNPKEKPVPDLPGHIRGNTLKTDDISRRLNSIKKAFTPEDAAKIGWNDFNDEIFDKRKNELYETNRKRFNVE